jgi:predicted  nucleic acid-binding Zn-ribbon protein
MSKEAEDLQTHVEICALRYQGIQDQMVRIDERFDKLETEFKDMKASTNKGFAEIKELIEKRSNSNNQSLITAAGTIIVALIGFLGYLLTHLPK